MKIIIKRMFDAPKKEDGFRVLVDRLWPRGVSKKSGRIDTWLKNVAPSSKLRIWFHASKVERLTEFERLYSREIKDSQDLTGLKNILREKTRVTLVTAVADFKHSHLPILVKNLSSSEKKED